MNAIFISASLFAALPFARAATAEPDFGPNVHIFASGQADSQDRINTIFKEMEAARFTPSRHAMLFKPGAYTLDIPVGFYTHAAGLGRLPGDVHITGAVRATAAWMGLNATCNFWRIAENFRVTTHNEDRINLWSASQAAPMRRMHIEGDLKLMEDGWASGGYLAQSKIEGNVLAGTQQQYIARNNSWKEWRGGAWSMVLVGNDNPPAEDWPARPYTVVPKTPRIREKPFLMIDAAGAYQVVVPALVDQPSQGVTWSSPGDRILPLSAFQIIRADRDNPASINAALQAGKHLLVMPGQYPLDAALVVTKPNTIVLGIGLPTFTPTAGNPALLVEAGEGVILAGLMIDAGLKESDVLVRVGQAGRRAGRADNPTTLHDIFTRVGGPGPGSVKTMMEIHDDHVIGDNFWIWRADHGKGVAWDTNPNDVGVLVTGNHVTSYGLAVEHTQGHQVVWNGEDGRVFFFQAEMPYDPPSQDRWMDGTSRGYAAYKVGPDVQRHQAIGLGTYHVFKRAPIVADRAIEAPDRPGISLRRMFIVRLQGGQPGSDIVNVVNNRPGTPHGPIMMVLDQYPASQRDEPLTDPD